MFVNKTIIVPFYREEYDTIAQRIYEDALPGYNIVGVDCDNSSNNIISLSGAIHCITHSVGVNDPLLISYKKIEDHCTETIPYVGLQALVQHRSGISEVFFNYRFTGDTEFTSVSMTDQGDDLWNVTMTFDELTEVEYYVHAISNDGKEQYRPMTALEGGVNSFLYSFDACDGFECVAELDPDCSFLAVWDPVCGCDAVTYSNSGEAACNNIFQWTQGPCESNTNLIDLNPSNKKLIQVVDIMGRVITDFKKGQVFLLIFDDGSIEKKIIN